MSERHNDICSQHPCRATVLFPHIPCGYHEEGRLRKGGMEKVGGVGGGGRREKERKKQKDESSF
jgi:hypothetical protein